ncbi:MAG: Cro/Cl family transcriptional regulator [Nitrosomonas sp.]|nr:Cro/Cl family transcriptional regulator [Nitrosomonas sp.]
MECLREYLNKKPKHEQVDFAKKCGTTIGYMRKAINTGQEIGTEISVCIEQFSDGEVTRQMLHPSNFTNKWPELAQSTNSEEAA